MVAMNLTSLKRFSRQTLVKHFRFDFTHFLIIESMPKKIKYFIQFICTFTRRKHAKEDINDYDEDELQNKIYKVNNDDNLNDSMFDKSDVYISIGL